MLELDLRKDGAGVRVIGWQRPSEPEMTKDCHCLDLGRDLKKKGDYPRPVEDNWGHRGTTTCLMDCSLGKDV